MSDKNSYVKKQKIKKMSLKDEIFSQENEHPVDISCNSVKTKQYKLSLENLYNLFQTDKTRLI